MRLVAKSNNITPLFRDFVMRCLRMDPVERSTAAELLAHPYLRAFTTKLQRKPVRDPPLQQKIIQKRKTAPTGSLADLRGGITWSLRRSNTLDGKKFVLPTAMPTPTVLARALDVPSNTLVGPLWPGAMSSTAALVMLGLCNSRSDCWELKETEEEEEYEDQVETQQQHEEAQQQHEESKLKKAEGDETELEGTSRSESDTESPAPHKRKARLSITIDRGQMTKSSEDHSSSTQVSDAGHSDQEGNEALNSHSESVVSSEFEVLSDQEPTEDVARPIPYERKKIEYEGVEAVAADPNNW